MLTTDLFNNRNIGLLLDFDGTLVDLAPNPNDIVIDPSLATSLDRIMREGNIPLAIVTGRQVSTIDQYLKLPYMPVSGNHGTEIRLPSSRNILCKADGIPATMWRELQSICQSFGCLLEDKIETASVHAPNEAAFYAAKNDIVTLLAQYPRYSQWTANLSLEIHMAEYSKVTGIRELLAHPRFQDCMPVYIGDDVHIYPGFSELEKDGVSFIPVEASAKKNGFTTPHNVRQFLKRLAQQWGGNDSTFQSLFAEFSCFYRGM